jgi:hypothetical protein
MRWCINGSTCTPGPHAEAQERAGHYALDTARLIVENAPQMKNLLGLALLFVSACVVNAGPPPNNNAAPTAAPASGAAPASTPAAQTPAPASSGTASASAPSAGGFTETEVPAEAPKEAKQSMADGRPKGFKAGAGESFWVWQDAKGSHWHLRSTTKDKPHRFHGVVVGDGELKKVASIRTESGDRFRLKGGKRASFDFSTEGASDGLDFDVANDSCVRFVLFVDGQPAGVDRINIGKDAAHPQGNNFKLCP